MQMKQGDKKTPVFIRALQVAVEAEKKEKEEGRL